MCRLSTRNLHNIVQCKNNFKNEKKCENKEGWTDMKRLKYLVVLIKKNMFLILKCTDNYTNVDLLLEIESSSRIVLLLS